MNEKAYRVPEVEEGGGREVGPGLGRDVVGEEAVRAAHGHVQDQVELSEGEGEASGNSVQKTNKRNRKGEKRETKQMRVPVPSGRRAPSWIQPPKGCRTSSPFRRNPRSCFQGPLSAAGPRPRRT